MSVALIPLEITNIVDREHSEALRLLELFKMSPGKLKQKCVLDKKEPSASLLDIAYKSKKYSISKS